MVFFQSGPGRDINLQATLAANSSTAGPQQELIEAGLPHHPITCNTELTYDEEGRIGCTHGQMLDEDSRTKAAVIHSIVILLFELLAEQEGHVPKRGKDA